MQVTEIMPLAKSLYGRIEWQNVTDPVTIEDMTEYIAEGIRHLYTMTGRALQFSEDMFVINEDVYVSFSEDLPLDEREYVILSAHIDFLRKVQTTVDDLTSYTTDAMSVTHGDKPYANLQQTITDLESMRRTIWYKMGRYHLL